MDADTASPPGSIGTARGEEDHSDDSRRESAILPTESDLGAGSGLIFVNRFPCAESERGAESMMGQTLLAMRLLDTA